MSRVRGFVFWTGIAIAFGCVPFFSGKLRTDVYTPSPPPSASPAASLFQPPFPLPPAPWSAVRSLDSLEGEWVSLDGPAVDDGGAVRFEGGNLRFEPMGSAPPGHRRWTFYAALGPAQLRCTLLGDDHEGFPGVCGGGTRAVTYHFAKDENGRLLFREYGQSFVHKQ
jgi:hypothetical protein